MMMPGVNYAMYGCYSARTTPEVSLAILELDTGEKLEENIVAVITENRVLDDKLKKQIKNQSLCTYRLFLLT